MPIQTETLRRIPTGGRVAIIRLRSLGDCVLTTPAIRLLKNFRPDLQLRVVAEERFAPIFGSMAMAPTAFAMRAFAPDLCLNLHGGTRSARLTLLSGARIRAGFAIFRPAWICNTPIPTAQETMGIARRVHTAEHLASAMFYLGVPLSEVPGACVAALPGRSKLAPEERYAVVHPLAATPEKTWPSVAFLEVANYLKGLGLQVVFIGGPGESLSEFAAYRTVTGAPLSEMSALLRDASFFVGNDSGPAHLAAAFGVPQVIIFGPSDAETWAPWRTPSRTVKADGPIAGITVEQVIAAIGEVGVR
ncbi:MAG: glycosyltransferase family 9 protein [Acidobacteriota bacterium]|nr:glycosyltransferase family 9 protein [Acidobacteriota bacterium]